MNDPRCPFCGAVMTARTAFYDKFQDVYTSHAKCWTCGAQGPIAKSNTSSGATNKALKNGTNRPRQRPLRWPMLEQARMVWLEDVDKEDVIPALLVFMSGKEYVWLVIGETTSVLREKAHYGKRWRAWKSKPTSKEREEAKWGKA